MDRLIVCNRAIQFKNDVAVLSSNEPDGPVTEFIASGFTRLRADALRVFGDRPSIQRVPSLHADKTAFAESSFIADGLAGIVTRLVRQEFEQSMLPVTG